MTQPKTIQALLLEHCGRYPALRPEDALKFIHQSTFGCGHLIDDPLAAAEYIRQEAAICRAGSGVPIELLDGGFCRVHLDYLKHSGIAPETFARLFALSACSPCGTPADLEARLSVLLELAMNSELPFSYEETLQAVAQWRRSGFGARHHSDDFRDAYAPAYRVLHQNHARLLPLFSAIDGLLTHGSRCLVAIEGGSASGKTSLAAVLSQIYDCNVFHMDDFFLRPEQRTPQRYAEPGGNVDRERFHEEVLAPISLGQPVSYRRFDCGTMTLSPAVLTEPRQLIVIEGTYSMHPELSPYYTLSVYLDIAPELQRARILSRNTPEAAEVFFNTWIPMEAGYFAATDPAGRCDITLNIDF